MITINTTSSNAITAYFYNAKDKIFTTKDNATYKILVDAALGSEAKDRILAVIITGIHQGEDEDHLYFIGLSIYLNYRAAGRKCELTKFGLTKEMMMDWMMEKGIARSGKMNSQKAIDAIAAKVGQVYKGG